MPGIDHRRAREVAEQGLSTAVLSRLVSTGKLERIASGVYILPGRALSEHRSLAEVALRVPRGVVCLLSALRVHGIGTQAPFELWLAIPHHSPPGSIGLLCACSACRGRL
ncbi:putative transcriptional regulator of viral defense system [Variovorax boronicumulans]|uniref:type IV toxin-antitoxin system AbiEi family antitoxin domain-containing protein n=1 Tax=Variovorax boronicumulans TaxID=436515 RepID=UPI002780D9D0|nr:AbiEi antitoxin N-terminal domain-containing protein [Variovorax boronicumulans]MDP9995660.1 putative transcriptional regulator of viral defense system [Variovorax boronicumulans]MDQ0006875.1 putative transcriptional regulator of viral defense system [Variovorax boronicumulans]MDQ0044526.1 putative transcriptional regulator of viral defense system [Variovorax boronicumulans]